MYSTFLGGPMALNERRDICIVDKAVRHCRDKLVNIFVSCFYHVFSFAGTHIHVSSRVLRSIFLYVQSLPFFHAICADPIVFCQTCISSSICMSHFGVYFASLTRIKTRVGFAHGLCVFVLGLSWPFALQWRHATDVNSIVDIMKLYIDDRCCR